MSSTHTSQHTEHNVTGGLQCCGLDWPGLCTPHILGSRPARLVTRPTRECVLKVLTGDAQWAACAVCLCYIIHPKAHCLWLRTQMRPAAVPGADLDEPVVAAEVGHAVHELLEVQVQVLKHQVQPPVSMDDVMQPAPGRQQRQAWVGLNAAVCGRQLPETGLKQAGKSASGRRQCDDVCEMKHVNTELLAAQATAVPHAVQTQVVLGVFLGLFSKAGPLPRRS